jgi:peptidylprolyl isomerase domain and WD repeat-containing protein 1
MADAANLSGKRPHSAVDADENGECCPSVQPDMPPSILTRQPLGAADSSDDDFGPALPSEVAPKKKRRKLPFEKVYVKALPASARYSKSLMHKEQLSFVTVTPFTDFVITSSVDGVVKFWKKMAEGIEFVKEFRAHPGEIRSVSVSADGRSFATAGADKTVKIFDVITFGESQFGMGPIDPIADRGRSFVHVYARVHAAVRLLGTSARSFSAAVGSDRRIEQYSTGV